MTHHICWIILKLLMEWCVIIEFGGILRFNVSFDLENSRSVCMLPYKIGICVSPAQDFILPYDKYFVLWLWEKKNYEAWQKNHHKNWRFTDCAIICVAPSKFLWAFPVIANHRYHLLPAQKSLLDIVHVFCCFLKTQGTSSAPLQLLSE